MTIDDVFGVRAFERIRCGHFRFQRETETLARDGSDKRRLTDDRQDPLVDFRLFRQPSYSAGVLLALAYFPAFAGIPLVLAIFYQQGLGYTPVQSALGVTAYAIGNAVGAPAAGRVVTRDELTAVLYQRRATPYERSLDVHVSHLRKKLERDERSLIRTIRGVGYQFAP